MDSQKMLKLLYEENSIPVDALDKIRRFTRSKFIHQNLFQLSLVLNGADHINYVKESLKRSIRKRVLNLQEIDIFLILLKRLPYKVKSGPELFLKRLCHCGFLIDRMPRKLSKRDICFTLSLIAKVAYLIFDG
jgi:hypothetical protein